MKSATITPFRIALLTLLVFLGIVFYPGDDSGDRLLWKTKWDAIEFNGIRLFRKKRLFRDYEYFVSSQDQNSKQQTVRRGGYAAKNFFALWDAPEVDGIYADSGESEQPPLFTIKLYESLENQPLVVSLLQKGKNGNALVRIDTDAYKSKIVALSSRFFSDLEKPPYYFRNRFFLEYPDHSFTESIRIETIDRKAVRYEWMQTPGTTGEPPVWRDSTGRTVPGTLISELEAAIHRIRIDRFRDEPGAPEEIERLWEEALPDTVALTVGIKKGETVELHLRNLTKNGQRIGLVSSSLESGVDFIDPKVADAISSAVSRLMREWKHEGK